MGLYMSPSLMNKKQSSPHQLLCLDAVPQALAQLYNTCGRKSYEFRIEKCGKNLWIGTFIFYRNSKLFSHFFMSS